MLSTISKSAFDLGSRTYTYRPSMSLTTGTRFPIAVRATMARTMTRRMTNTAAKNSLTFVIFMMA